MIGAFLCWLGEWITAAGEWLSGHKSELRDGQQEILRLLMGVNCGVELDGQRIKGLNAMAMRIESTGEIARSAVLSLRDQAATDAAMAIAFRESRQAAEDLAGSAMTESIDQADRIVRCMTVMVGDGTPDSVNFGSIQKSILENGAKLDEILRLISPVEVLAADDETFEKTTPCPLAADIAFYLVDQKLL